MNHLTPIGSRLSASLNDEYLRMQNEWFFKWHSIGEDRAVEIDSFQEIRSATVASNFRVRRLMSIGIPFSIICARRSTLCSMAWKRN